ncbi:hypothetical protein Lal_00004254 [Lupinus albus]|nr:hypothetical protein Lal_00004254 [Lupinus albus]
MFRSAVLRSVRVAARPAMRSFAVAPRVATAAVPKIQSFQAVRFYSAGGALNKEEVEGRIMSLLKGFDKVRNHFRDGNGFTEGIPLQIADLINQ